MPLQVRIMKPARKSATVAFQECRKAPITKAILFSCETSAQSESQSAMKTTTGTQARTTLTAATFNLAMTNSTAGSGRTAINGGIERLAGRDRKSVVEGKSVDLGG